MSSKPVDSIAKLFTKSISIESETDSVELTCNNSTLILNGGDISGSTSQFEYLNVSLGTVSNPSIKRKDDNNTGIFFPTASNTFAITTAGSQRLFVNSVRTGIGSNFSSPGSQLHVWEGNSGQAPNGSAGITLEKSSTTYFQILVPNSSNAGVIFGSPVSTARGGIIYSFNNTGSAENLQFYAGGSAKMYVSSSGDISIPLGNLVFSTTGKGIDFSITDPATTGSSGSVGGEVLNDYEEGTWTPELTSSNSILPNQTTKGTYTKIGNVVNLNYRVTISSTGNTFGSAQLNIRGFPFNSSAVITNINYANSVYVSGLSSTGSGSIGHTALLTTNDSAAALYKRTLNVGTTSAMAATDITNSCTMVGNLSYTTDQ